MDSGVCDHICLGKIPKVCYEFLKLHHMTDPPAMGQLFPTPNKEAGEDSIASPISQVKNQKLRNQVIFQLLIVCGYER